MGISTIKREDVIIISIEGQVNANKVPLIKKIIDEQIENKQKKIIINLEKTTSIDSAGIGILITSLSNIKKGGGQFKLLNVHDSVKEKIEATKLTSFLDIYDNEEKAIANFN